MFEAIRNIFSQGSQAQSHYEYEREDTAAKSRFSDSSYASAIELAQKEKDRKISKYSRKQKELKYEYKHASRMIQAARVRKYDLEDQVSSLRKDISEVQRIQKGWPRFFIVLNDIRLQIIPLLKIAIDAHRLEVGWKHIIVFIYRHITNSASDKAKAYETYRIEATQTQREIEEQLGDLRNKMRDMESQKAKIRRKKKKAKKKKKKLKSGY